MERRRHGRRKGDERKLAPSNETKICGEGEGERWREGWEREGGGGERGEREGEKGRGRGEEGRGERRERGYQPTSAGHVIIVVVRDSSSLKSGKESRSVDHASESGTSEGGRQSSGLRGRGASLEADKRTRRRTPQSQGRAGRRQDAAAALTAAGCEKRRGTGGRWEGEPLTPRAVVKITVPSRCRHGWAQSSASGSSQAGHQSSLSKEGGESLKTTRWTRLRKMVRSESR